MRRISLGAAVAGVALAALVAAPVAAADLGDEQALAERHAPVVRLVAQTDVCGPGEPFVPTEVDRLLDDDTVALRGPWNRTDLVKIGPGAEDLVGRYEYHLDFPGDPLDAGCDYKQWARRLTRGSKPTVYAHVVSEPARPGKVALQYWFFYPFNDFNNTHEGDWEMIQLVFDAADAQAALDEDPVDVGYSSHEGAERASWDDDKLEVVDGTRPAVYPSRGSHANKYGSALWLGSSADAGVGCDDTRAPHTELLPVVQTIPSDDAAARAAYPWIAFEGRWGELQKAFFNGPTAPTRKHNGRSRSPGPTTGETGATPSRSPGSSGPRPRTSSAARSRGARRGSSSFCATPASRCSFSPRSSASPPSRSPVRRGLRSHRCGSLVAGPGGRSSPPRPECT
jgi:hypothetical protein